MTKIELQLFFFLSIKIGKPITKSINISFQQLVKTDKNYKSLYNLCQTAFEAKHTLYFFIQLLISWQNVDL